MKRLRMLLVVLTVCGLIFGLTANVYGEEQKKQPIEKSELIVKTVCLDGKLFAIAATYNDVAIVQVYKQFNRFANPPVPQTCNTN